MAEVLVLGGGPAGATAALRLSQLGHRVRLIERRAHTGGQGHAAHVAEALPSGLQPLLASLGVLDAINGAGFLRPSLPQVDWPGLPEANAVPGKDSDRGWLVDRHRLATLLRRAAARAGVELLAGQAGAAERQEGRWQVAVRAADGTRSVLSSDLLIDARGRRGNSVQPATSARTVALLALWQTGSAGAASEPCMRVQAVPQGWVWFAPLVHGAVNVGVFVDADEVAGLDAAQRSRLYHTLIADATLLAPLLQGCRCGPLRSTDATARCVPDAAPEDGRLIVGDAAVGLDPLSSHGVQAALRSAVQAAACAHTAWHRPEDAALASQFHRRQSAQLAARHARWGAALHAAPAERWGEAFWQRRMLAAAQPHPPVDPATPAWPVLDDRLALAPGVRLSEAPVLEGDWVIGRPVLQSDDGDRSAAWVAGVPVSHWLAPLGRRPAPRLADLLDEWRTRFGAKRTEAAFSHLWQQRLICRAGSSYGRRSQ